jgi:hypothetical protein
MNSLSAGDAGENSTDEACGSVFSSILRNENSRKTTRVFHGFRKGENSKRPIRNMKLTNPSKPSTVVCALQSTRSENRFDVELSA